MEDQGKRLLLAVLAAFAVMLLWNFLFPPEPPPPRDAEPNDTQQGDTAGDATRAPGPTPDQPARTPAVASEQASEVQPVVEDAPEQLFEFDLPEYRAVFTSHGGNLKSWELKGSKYQHTKAGVTRQLDMVRTEGDALFAMRFQDLDLPANASWQGHKKSDTEIQFTWPYMVRDRSGASVVAFEITKTYRLHVDTYLLELTIDVVNRAPSDELQTISDRQAVVVSLYGYQDPTEKTGGGWTQVDSSWKSACHIGDEVSTSAIDELGGGGRKMRSGDVAWGGFLHSYFLVAAAPRVETTAALGCNSYGVQGHPGLMRTDIVFPVANMRRGGPPVTQTLVAYLGPKYLDTLEAIPGIVGFDPKLSASIDLGWFEILARPMLWLLQWFYSFLGNWGLAIIFLTFLVKLATLYPTQKSMRSMKAMAKLKPQMEAIQKKYAKDRERQQQEVMALYKAHKVNPLAGCLPIFLQMPIWFALYKMLSAAAELYHAPFIPGWIDDLTAEDPFYVLPILLIVLMFVQARLSPTPADSTQQKVMMYGLPVMFGVFSFFFPAGLTLYICTNTVLTALHSLWMNRDELRAKKDKARTAIAKAVEPEAAGKSKSTSADAETATEEPDEASTTARAGGDGVTRDGTQTKKARKGGQPKRRGGKRR